MPTMRSPGSLALLTLALLRTDSTAITLTQSTAPPHANQVFLKNTGAAGLHVRHVQQRRVPRG